MVIGCLRRLALDAMVGSVAASFCGRLLMVVLGCGRDVAQGGLIVVGAVVASSRPLCAVAA